MDVAGELLNHGLFAMAHEAHLLVHQVLDDIARGGAAHVDPDAREEGAGAHDESAVEEAMEGVANDVHPLAWRANVVREATDRS